MVYIRRDEPRVVCHQGTSRRVTAPSDPTSSNILNYKHTLLLVVSMFVSKFDSISDSHSFQLVLCMNLCMEPVVVSCQSVCKSATEYIFHIIFICQYTKLCLQKCACAPFSLPFAKYCDMKKR